MAAVEGTEYIASLSNAKKLAHFARTTGSAQMEKGGYKMKKYIDYDSLEQETYEMFCHARQQADLVVANTIKAMIDEQPDALVRCKDCKHGKPGACGHGVDCDGVWHDDDWFCADGEKRETES